MAMENKPYVIGLDLGGTNSVFGIVNAEGSVVTSTSIRTKGQNDLDVYMDSACAALAPMIEQVGGIQNIKGMGIGAPNGNYYTGNIELAPNLPWKGIVPFAKKFSDRLGIPVVLTNDANAAAYRRDDLRGSSRMKNFIMITLGTGVGSGIVVNGELVYGCDGFAGELGHVIVDTTPEAAYAVAVVKGVWRLIVRPRAWLGRLVSFSPSVRTTRSCVKSRWRRLRRKMYPSQPSTATNLHAMYISLPVNCWDALVPILPPSVARRHTCFSVG